MLSELVPAGASPERIRVAHLADLVPYERNARTHSADQVAAIAASIREFGATNPILVAERGSIVAGHGRKLAAELIYDAGDTIKLPSGLDLPWGTFPVVDCTGWSDKQRRAYILADNKLAEQAGWDAGLLKLELGSLLADGFDLGLTGFSGEEIAALLADKTEGLTDPNSAPEVPVNPCSEAGDVWLLGNHRLACGSCTDAHTVEAVLGDRRPALMVTDPPYGVNCDANWRNEAARTSSGMGNRALGAGAVGKVLNEDQADWREAWALFPGQVAYVWHGGLHAATVAESLQASAFAIRSQVVWVKHRFAISRGDLHWQHEPAWVAERGEGCFVFEDEHELAAYAVRKGKPGRWRGGRKQSTVWNIEHVKSETGHSTQKPVDCMRRPIENNSAAGEAVYEPFSGSGTTIIAGEMTGRHVLAIELNPAYVDVGVVRWQQFTGREAVLESTGETFAAVAAARGRG